jgi:hypothetical protein
LGLKRFLLRIEAHPKLGDCEIFQKFLKAPIIGIIKNNANVDCNSKESLSSTNSSSSSSYLKPVMDSLGEVLAATFLRSPKKVPDHFLKLKKEVKIVKNHLSHLERLFNNRIAEHQPAIIEGMKEIAGNFDELSASINLSLNPGINNMAESSSMASDNLISPPFVKSMLSRVSATMTQCAHLLDKSIDDQELNLLAVLLEYSQYCDSALELIETRDRRQVEVEELNKLVEEYENEIGQLDGSPHRKEADIEGIIEDKDNNEITSNSNSKISLSGSGSFINYLSNKWESWKGVDPITSRKNRLEKIQTKLKETKSALKTSHHLSFLLDSTLPQEIAVFLQTLKDELGKEFLNHSRSQVNYHETNLVYWKDFLAWLDNPPKHL